MVSPRALLGIAVLGLVALLIKMEWSTKFVVMAKMGNATSPNITRSVASGTLDFKSSSPSFVVELTSPTRGAADLRTPTPTLNMENSILPSPEADLGSTTPTPDIGESILPSPEADMRTTATPAFTATTAKGAEPSDTVVFTSCKAMPFSWRVAGSAPAERKCRPSLGASVAPGALQGRGDGCGAHGPPAKLYSLTAAVSNQTSRAVGADDGADAACANAGRWVDPQQCVAAGAAQFAARLRRLGHSTITGENATTTTSTTTTPLGFLFLGDSHCRLLGLEVGRHLGVGLPNPGPWSLWRQSFEVNALEDLPEPEFKLPTPDMQPPPPPRRPTRLRHTLAHGDAIFRFGAHLDWFFGALPPPPAQTPPHQFQQQPAQSNETPSSSSSFLNPPTVAPKLIAPPVADRSRNGGLTPRDFTHVVVSRGFWDILRNFDPPALLSQYMRLWDDVVARFPPSTHFIQYELHTVFPNTSPGPDTAAFNLCNTPWRMALVRAAGTCAAYRTVRRYREEYGRHNFTIQRFVLTKETSKQRDSVHSDGHHFGGDGLRSHAQKFLRLFVCPDASDYADDEVAALGFHEPAAAVEGEAACALYEAQKDTPYDTTHCTCLSNLNPTCVSDQYDRALGRAF